MAHMSRVYGKRGKPEATKPYRSRAEMLAAEAAQRQVSTPKLPYVSFLDPNRKTAK